MEKHFYFGVGILLAFLILGFLVAFFMDTVCDPISLQLENAAVEAMSGDLEKGISLALEAKQRWAEDWKKMATVADHTPIDEIEGLFAEMEVFAQARDAEHFSACCAQLSRRMEAMADAHSLTWWNLI